MPVLETELATRASRGLPRYTIVGRTDAPVVVVLGGISATRHVVFGDSPSTEGWWSKIAGEEKAIDITRWRVLSLDYMDGGRDGRGRPRRVITTHDQALWLARVLRALRIERVHAVIGASYGGMVALAFAERFPRLVERLVVISAAHEAHPMSTALRTLQRRIVELGLETGRPADAMSIARGVAMTTYRTAGEFAERFGATAGQSDGRSLSFAESTLRSAATNGPGMTAVDAYLRDRGSRFAASMPPERFLALSLSTDLHRIDPSRITTPATLVAAEGDAVVPRSQLVDLAGRIAGQSCLVDLPTRVGHDAFLVETAKVSAILTAALD